MMPLRISRADDKYPQTLIQILGNRAPKNIFALGNLDLLGQETIALFCSLHRVISGGHAIPPVGSHKDTAV